jgi:ABC-type multidrug transport system fused ATPase/permease subunit
VSEAGVREALNALMLGRTTILVTHRLSSLREDDTVIVLDKGRVVWGGWYGNLAALPGDVRASLREWETQAAK